MAQITNYHNRLHRFVETHDCTVGHAFHGPEGTILFIKPDEDPELPVPFFSPAQTPQSFYELSYFSCGATHSYPCNQHYGFNGGKDKEFFLYIHYGKEEDAGATMIICNANEYTGDDPLDDEENRFASRGSEWSALSTKARRDLSRALKQDQLHLYSTPIDHYISGLYAMPDNHDLLKGHIVFTTGSYRHHDHRSIYVPYDPSAQAESLQFYENGKMLRPADLTAWPLSRREKSLTISLSEDPQQPVDFSDCQSLYFDDAKKKELTQSGRVPGVPAVPTPLMTPVTCMELLGLMASPARATTPVPPPPAFGGP